MAGVNYVEAIAQQDVISKLLGKSFTERTFCEQKDILQREKTGAVPEKFLGGVRSQVAKYENFTSFIDRQSWALTLNCTLGFPRARLAPYSSPCQGYGEAVGSRTEGLK